MRDQIKKAKAKLEIKQKGISWISTNHCINWSQAQEMWLINVKIQIDKIQTEIEVYIYATDNKQTIRICCAWIRVEMTNSKGDYYNEWQTNNVNERQDWDQTLMLRIHADMDWSAIQTGAECGSSDETIEKWKLK